MLSDSVGDFVGYSVGDLVGDSVGDYGGDSVARICLRAQPLESSLGRVPQAADVTCGQTSKIGSCRSPRTV